MGYKKGSDKTERSLFPLSLDEQISDDNICRMIDAFTKLLDMSELGFKYAQHNNTGNRPYDPRIMLSLYIYGYLHRIRSSRRLETETYRNIEVMWLMAGLKPNNKTISNFRKDNSESLRLVFREFNNVCRRLGLFGGTLTATDGTKFRASNSRKNNHTKTAVDKKLSSINKQISEYMNALEQADATETDDIMPSSKQIKDALVKLNDRKNKFEFFSKRIETESEISTVDPDSRLMRSGGDARKLDVCYNVQTIVDAKNKLIVDFDISDCSDDKGNLHNMTEKAKEVMGVDTLTNLSDKGYYDGEDIVACEDNGVVCLVSKPRPGGAKKGADFKRDKFKYNREKNCYICPLGNELGFRYEDNNKNGKKHYIYSNSSACRKCPKKSDCTNADYRTISRVYYQDKLDIVDKRTIDNKELYSKRQEIIEHVFGTIKSVWGYKQFLCRSKPKVSAEVSLAYLCYNFRRVFNIYDGDVKKLAEAMRICLSYFFNFLLKMDIFLKISTFLKNMKWQLKFNCRN